MGLVVEGRVIKRDKREEGKIKSQEIGRLPLAKRPIVALR